MPTKAEDRVIFLCGEHQFVIVCDSHGTPGHRQKGCASCDKAVDDAFAHIGWPLGGDDEGSKSDG